MNLSFCFLLGIITCVCGNTHHSHPPIGYEHRVSLKYVSVLRHLSVGAGLQGKTVFRNTHHLFLCSESQMLQPALHDIAYKRCYHRIANGPAAVALAQSLKGTVLQIKPLCHCELFYTEPPLQATVIEAQ